MKKILLGFLFAFFYLPFIYPVSYNELRQAFKDRLYGCQNRLMQDKNKYYECIEPYIKEAEKNLVIIRYCIDNPDFVNTSEEFDISLLLKYFDCLLAYNCSFFNYYVNPDAVRTARLEYSAENLMDAIKAFKEKVNIAHLNVKQEYNKTINLFQKANKAYYKELPIRVRIITCITSYINFIRSSTTIHTGLTVHREIQGINFCKSL